VPETPREEVSTSSERECQRTGSQGQADGSTKQLSHQKNVHSSVFLVVRRRWLDLFG
jgi:hypothetical protein